MDQEGRGASSVSHAVEAHRLRRLCDKSLETAAQQDCPILTATSSREILHAAVIAQLALSYSFFVDMCFPVRYLGHVADVQVGLRVKPSCALVFPGKSHPFVGIIPLTSQFLRIRSLRRTSLAPL